MYSLPFRAPLRNKITTPEFPNQNFEFPDADRVPATAAGAHLHRRYHVAPGIADLLGLLAGLGEEPPR
jgi:hypothetical protein